MAVFFPINRLPGELILVMPPHAFKKKRKSHIDIGEIYFWTATINKWQKLLFEDRFKDVIISSLNYLSDLGKIDVYAFVIMPTHIHLIWKILELNGKELPHASFLKFTAHQFEKILLAENKLASYYVSKANKVYEFWKRDSLAVRLYSRKIAIQKLNYIHNNPLGKHWQLARNPCEYPYSSARFYEKDENSFPFLKNLWEVI